MKYLDIIVVTSFALLDMVLNLLHSSDAVPTHWCPIPRYPSHDGKCKLCHEYCGREGCTGPRQFMGMGGCSSCWLGMESRHNMIKCLSPFSSCPEGYYRKIVTHDGHSFPVCHQCHTLCRTCSGPGIAFCDTCTFLEIDGVCVRACPLGTIMRGRRRTCVLFGGYSRHRPFHLLPYRDRYRHITA